MRLSVIIVNYNVEYFLEQCLLSVQKAIGQLEVEVIVVDNASVDGSIEMLKKRFPEIKLIANSDNRGFSKANNQGIRIAQGDYILLLNPDTVVEEDTFKTCIEFMDKHPEGGGLGVRMLDGKGKFLPESKRGLPTPRVAFYKIFGLSKLFPSSAKFNSYHLGHLDENESHEVEILSGAFMFMRKTALDKVGLLDEDYFMYGEDIDLSYRLIKGGYKNYYTPSTRIIHYKGESTKKTSVNYVMVFYNAMRIFARKHFSSQHAKSFNKLIEFAIYVRAFLSIAKRIFVQLIHPLLDLILVLLGLIGLSSLYAQKTGIVFQENLLKVGLPAYCLLWVSTAFLSSAYEHPLKDRRKLQGILIGTALILILYSLLPEEFRFSRAIILLGTVLAMVLMLLTNMIWRKLEPHANIKEDSDRRFAIVGAESESNRIRAMMTGMGIPAEAIFSIDSAEGKVNTEQLKSMTNIHHIDEVIFCAKDLSAERIIDLMSGLDSSKLDYKIAPSESMFIIGSNSKDSSGDLLAFELNSIGKPVNRRNKRILDFFMSLLLTLCLPIALLVQKKPLVFVSNVFRVLFGKNTWVGYHSQVAGEQQLPKLKHGVLNPDSPLDIATEQERKSNLLYAKDYSVAHDLDIILRNWRRLGTKTS